MTRRKGHARVLQSIHTALALGYDPVKVNVVVMRGQNDDELVDFVRLTEHDAVNVRFIEYMPFDGNVWSDAKMVSFRDMMGTINAAFPDRPLQRCADPKVGGCCSSHMALWCKQTLHAPSQHDTHTLMLLHRVKLPKTTASLVSRAPSRSSRP